MTKAWTWAGAIMLASVLAACNQTGGGVNSAVGLATGLDPTGLSGAAVDMAQSVRDDSEPEDESDELDLGELAPRLRAVAAGNTARPNIMATVEGTMDEMMALQAMSLASSVARAAIDGVLSGGTSLVDSAPNLAMQAAGTGMVASRMAAARGQARAAIAQAEAERAADRIVPDADRPAEARAILSVLDGPGIGSAAWQNPATGASGRVTVQTLRRKGPNSIVCRLVKQEWTGGGRKRNGSMTICRSGGEWYDLS